MTVTGPTVGENLAPGSLGARLFLIDRNVVRSR